MRWTSAETSLKLPVIPGKAYEIVLDIHQPETAIDAAGGLYLGKQRVVTFPPHAILGTVGGTIPAGTADHVELHLRSKLWQPSKTIKDSWDQRPARHRPVQRHDESRRRNDDATGRGQRAGFHPGTC